MKRKKRHKIYCPYCDKRILLKSETRIEVIFREGIEHFCDFECLRKWVGWYHRQEKERGGLTQTKSKSNGSLFRENNEVRKGNEEM